MITRKLCQLGEDGLIIYDYKFRPKLEEVLLRRGIIPIMPLQTVNLEEIRRGAGYLQEGSFLADNHSRSEVS
jgi:hypothetical protein